MPPKTEHVAPDELERRRAEWIKPEPGYTRGYGYMYLQHIEQPPEGCDFGFLNNGIGTPAGEPEIH